MELPAVPALPIRTARLVLRPFSPEDRDLTPSTRPGCGALCALRAAHREKVAEVLLRKVASTELRKQGDLLELAVTLADDPTVIGDVLLALQSVEHQTLEVGHIFARRLAGAATRRRRSAPWSTGVRPDRGPADHRPRRRPQPLVLRAAGAARFRLEAHLVENEWVQGRADERAWLRSAVPRVAAGPREKEQLGQRDRLRPASSASWVRQENPSASTTASGWAAAAGSRSCSAIFTETS